MEAMVSSEGDASNRVDMLDAAQAQAVSVCAAPSTAEPCGRRSKTKIARGLWAAAGFICFALGMVGVALPILPTTPFILLAAFCFARSSERVNTWFKGTKVYKKVLEGYVTKRSMTMKAKLAILVPVTILLSIGFALMGRVPVGRAVLVVVWACHVVYFGFVVKTDRESKSESEEIAE